MHAHTRSLTQALTHSRVVRPNGTHADDIMFYYLPQVWFLFYYYCFVCEIFYLLAFYAVIFKRTIFYNFLLLIIFFFSCSNLVVSNEKVPLVVESFLLQRASESVHFAIRTYLYMLANPVVCCVPFMRLYSLFLSFVLVCESIHYLNMLANPVENLLLSTLVRMNEC